MKKLFEKFKSHVKTVHKTNCRFQYHLKNDYLLYCLAVSTPKLFSVHVYYYIDYEFGSYGCITPSIMKYMWMQRYEEIIRFV